MNTGSDVWAVRLVLSLLGLAIVALIGEFVGAKDVALGPAMVWCWLGILASNMVDAAINGTFSLIEK